MSKVTAKEVMKIMSSVPTSADVKTQLSEWKTLGKKFTDTRKALTKTQGEFEKAMDKKNGDHKKILGQLKELIASCETAEEILKDAIEENKEALAFLKADAKRVHEALQQAQKDGKMGETLDDDNAEMTSQIKMMQAIGEQHALSVKQTKRQPPEHQRIVKEMKKLQRPIDKVLSDKKAKAK